jgi:hypothetical protein
MHHRCSSAVSRHDHNASFVPLNLQVPFNTRFFVAGTSNRAPFCASIHLLTILQVVSMNFPQSASRGTPSDNSSYDCKSFYRFLVSRSQTVDIPLLCALLTILNRQFLWKSPQARRVRDLRVAATTSAARLSAASAKTCKGGSDQASRSRFQGVMAPR